MLAGIGTLAREEGNDDFTLTVESGPIGGTLADKLSFGASVYPQAVIDHAAMFDFYDGGGLRVSAGDGRLRIEQEGRVSKLGPQVGQLSFNGRHVQSLGHQVRYITGRAVFELRQGNLVLTEIAPGIELQRQVLDVLAAPVVVAQDLVTMDARIFRAGPMF